MKTILCPILIMLAMVPDLSARRALPDTTLAIPVLITFTNGPLKGSGSGFFLQCNEDIYFVTARHVLISNVIVTNSRTNFTALAPTIWLRGDMGDANDLVLTLDLTVLATDNRFRPHPTRDVLLIQVGRMITNKQPHVIESLPGTTFIKGHTTSVPLDQLKKFDDILVSNTVYLFGYPTSLANPDPEFPIDETMALPRKGMISGLNRRGKRLILDCPSYQGQSGGPLVMEDVISPVETKFYVIGIVLGSLERNAVNTGYTVAEPIDSLLDLLK